MLSMLGFAGAVLLILPALVFFVTLTRDLDVPPDTDHYRDSSQAQATLDGAPFADPFYRGEYIWYNPLLPWTVAAGSAASGWEPLRFHVRAGPWLNLLGPLGMYTLGATTYGHPAGLASTAAYVCLTCGAHPDWMCGTYSPWLFASQPAQGLFFFFSLVLLVRAHRQLSPRLHLAAGALAGVTFLTHTAPGALLLASFVASLLDKRLAASRIRGRAARYYLLAFGTVAVPYVVVIVGVYRLRIRNPVPMSWEVPELTLAGFPGFLASFPIAIGLLGAVGAAFLLLRRSPEDRLNLTWLAVSASFVLYGVLRHWSPLRELSLPTPLPTFHWWIYVSAGLTLLFGISCGTILKLARLRTPAALAIVMAVFGALIYIGRPEYVQRDHLVWPRTVVSGRNPEFVRVSRLLRRATGPDNVVLATYRAGLMLVGPAGRKTVAVQAHFSNPYVDYEQRAADRDRMFADLESGNLESFSQLAAQYGVTHVIGNGRAHCEALRRGGGTALRLVHQFEEFCLLGIAIVRPD